jgi:transcriptional regulator with XRE-family HTH domain
VKKLSVVLVWTHSTIIRSVSWPAVRKAPLNLVGPQVRKWRNAKGWTQEELATKLQLRGWDISRDSVASLESQRRRVPDCEILFLARVLNVRLAELFPRSGRLSRIGPQFQSRGKLALFPTRGGR